MAAEEAAAEQQEASKPQPVQKAGSFKRIAGMLTGESKRKVGEPKADGDSTVYGVDVDERSKASKAASTDKDGDLMEANYKKPYMLKVVLLLMDPSTRRFELLQLEFDSMKALVSDVLAQIPVSVTEAALRKQTYKGITGKDGVEMGADKLLASFCNGNDVLVAVPTNMAPTECARLAKPILVDDKVLAMLLSSGIDAKDWKDAGKGAPSTPTKSDTAPGLKETPTSPPALTRDLPDSLKPNSLAGGGGGSGGSAVNLVSMIVFFALLGSILLQVFHLYISAPIKPGHVVSPGIWLSKCGLLSFLPGCDNEYLTVEDNGSVTLYDQDEKMIWQIQGDDCSNNKSSDTCVPGMQLEEDGQIIVGGKSISWVTMYKESDLAPWPFSEKPKVRVWKK